MDRVPEYRYCSADPTHANAYLWPVLRKRLETQFGSSGSGLRAFDLGSGNGATSNFLREFGFDVYGVDTSNSGVALARKFYPRCHFEVASVYDDLAGRYGRFDVVVSLEVIEHLYDPRKFMARTYELLKPGSPCMISTPYHGYLKNLALAFSGKMDRHFTALWDGGHIKFWSEKTLGHLLAESRFENIQFDRAGRIAPLAKSMLAIATKPI
ncbi:MAG: class I SAM-dependent methyltransferase [Hyphomicrobium sp.]